MFQNHLMMLSYQRRKLETLSFNSNIKEFWIKNELGKYKSYAQWLKTVFTKEYQVFVSENIFNLVLKNNPKNI